LRMRVLIVEDDAKLARLVQQGLFEEGHDVTIAPDGGEALAVAERSVFDVIVLDIMLPVMDGLTVARRLRSAGNARPILMLTGRDANADVVRGLDAGADDYLTKPFSFEVLLARLRALTRRATRGQSPVLQVADLCLDPAAHTVRRGPATIPLTPTEFSILESLMRRAGRAVPRQTLIEDVWGYERDIESNTLDAFIRLLRAKVDSNADRKLIQTVRGIGFSIREEL
jgi:DNA-binding response OmpR family regulator